MNLKTIFDAVAKLMGKDHTGGYFAPDEITTCAIYVNKQLFSKKRKEYESDRTSDDTRIITKTMGDSINPPLLLNSSGVGDLPTDYEVLSTVRWCKVTAKENIDCDDPKTWVNKEWKMVEVVTDDQLSDRLGNKLKGPTLDNPICTIQNNKLHVWPEDVPYVQFTYLRTPVDPKYDFIIGTDDTYSYLPPGSTHDGTNPDYASGVASTSVEFEWPESCFDEIVALCLQYFGVAVTDGMAVQVGTQKAVENG